MMEKMGIGKITDATSLRRKWYWTIALYDQSGKLLVPDDKVRISARPNLTIEETAIDFLGTSFIPGKSTWEELVIKKEIDENNDASCLLCRLINDHLVEEHAAKFDAVLKLNYNSGTGESWKMKDCFFTSVNYGPLDFSNSSPPELEAKIRYSSARYNPGTFMV